MVPQPPQHLQNMPLPDQSHRTAQLLIQSLVTSHLDYCNSLLIGNHSVSSTPLCQSLHSVSSTPLCRSLHWPPFSVLHPSLPIPPLASIQCPPPPSANPSTGLHSVSSTPLCRSLHWPPFSVLHPSLPIPPELLPSYGTPYPNLSGCLLIYPPLDDP
ncbi:unnamed protein product [Staurois parvus]|uniref:Uncharacterized protein n=1 Tax=Staurois parvus TaxID=386267 RepID=A0ABN9F2Y4_9NEOB|nr:unnamed protein product [Staurois parvus]